MSSLYSLEDVEKEAVEHDHLPTAHTMTFNLPRTVTIDEGVGGSRDRELRRFNSVGGLMPQRVDTASRIVGEFRTLSIHVAETQQRPKEVKKQAVKELASLDWHLISKDEALQRLSVAPTSGLDTEQASRRLAANGPNSPTPPKNRWYLKVLGYIFGGFGSLLVVAAILVLISWKPLGEPDPQLANLALGIVLLIVIALQTAFNAWQDFSTGRVMASISGMLPAEVIALRNGVQVHLPARELVNGDLVYVSLGNKLPADLRFIQVSSDLKLDRAVLTGESEPINGTVDSTDANFLETKNVGLQGTLCVSGSGLGLVIQTGDNTVFGRIAKLSSTGAPSLTTLQKEILHFVIIIVSLALSLALIVIILWGAWLNKKHHGFINVPTLIVDVVSVCVAFIPEGLPACVTISLSVVANRLAKEKVLCKSLMTVETLGSVNVLCSDKTGTLTKNIMTVTKTAVLDAEFSTETAKKAMEDKNENVAEVAAIAGICNSAVFDETTMDRPIGLRAINGDATDSAILRFAESLRPVNESNGDWEEVFKVNFNSKTKFMLKLLRLASTPSAPLPAPIGAHDDFATSDLMLLCKGAPDVLIKRCTQVNNPSGGEPLPLLPEVLARLVSVQEAWAAKGQRVLLLAKRVIPLSTIDPKLSFEHADFSDYVNRELNQNLTVVGLVGLVDPPRDDIPDTVRIMRGAGIRFFMVTGDFALTAVAIAEQCGIISNSKTIHRLANLDRDQEKHVSSPSGGISSLVLSGPDLMEMNENQWEQACGYQEIVFARTTPEQKLRIVKEFQSRECIVGMTGDGVNDAPSLKAADVGIAMGGGSDVAMEAADLILLDSFSSIVVGVEYGRLVFDNLRKTCLYLLPAGTFSELLPVLLNIILGLPQILSSLQMIFICVLTDVTPAISLCFEKPETGVLTRPPRDTKTEKLVDFKLLTHAYFVLGLLESLCAMSMAFWYLQTKGFRFRDLVLSYGGIPAQYNVDDYNEAVRVAQSIYFFTLVGMQWGNLLATRTRRLSIFQQNPFFGPKRNLWIPPAMVTSVGLLFFLSYVPFFQRIFGTRGVPVEHIFLPFVFALGILFMDEARKFWVRKYPKGVLGRMAW
ncbi:hypothetical protein P7C73_g4728, partial [Tremellales sp. Uapishka_1]